MSNTLDPKTREELWLTAIADAVESGGGGQEVIEETTSTAISEEELGTTVTIKPSEGYTATREVEVDVATLPVPSSTDLQVSENGIYTPSSAGVDYYSMVEVDVAAEPDLVELRDIIVDNGTYTSSPSGHDGYNYVELSVNVSGGYTIYQISGNGLQTFGINLFSNLSSIMSAIQDVGSLSFNAGAESYIIPVTWTIDQSTGVAYITGGISNTGMGAALALELKLEIVNNVPVTTVEFAQVYQNSAWLDMSSVFEQMTSDFVLDFTKQTA